MSFDHIVIAFVIMSVAALFIAILIDFYLYQGKGNTRHEKRSMVATGSMVAFFIVYYLVLRFNLGGLTSFSGWLNNMAILVGAASVVTGTIINIAGRIRLKGNWANHIKIYEDHKIVTQGVYSYVRHPLYASIILMLIGGSLIYRNWLSAILVSFLFIPAMIFRARQEEQLLIREFPGYLEYKRQVGMFFPKRLRGYENERV